MKILHYALGFPPYRTGGLTKYCLDIMMEEKKMGHTVGMLWPGRMEIIRKKHTIKKSIINDFDSYELMNPLPVSLDQGIVKIPLFTGKSDKNRYRSFLEKECPTIIHFHTFMGIHKEFLEAANELSIKMIYSAHDFFGLCPKVTFFRNHSVCTEGKECYYCEACCSEALSISKIKIMQSRSYRCLKNTSIIKKIRKKERSNFFEKNTSMISETTVSKANVGITNKYQYLRQYYTSMFDMMDCIHFNSSVTEKIYLEYIKPKKSKVISISNKEISNHKYIKNIPKKVQLGLLSVANPAKGYLILKQALDELYQEGYCNFILNIYDGEKQINDYIVSHNSYQYGALGEILSNIQVVVIPSCSYETFSFIVLEALSYGVPVIVSDYVGAKDLIEDGESGYIIEPSIASLKATIKKVLDNPQKVLRKMNQYIVENQKIKTIKEHTQEIVELYTELIQR